MTVLHAVSLLVVAVAAPATVLARDPLRQAVVGGFLGGALALFLLAYGAPDVALSEIVVAGVALPAITLLALDRIGHRTDRE